MSTCIFLFRVTTAVMKLQKLRQEDSSSGYGSRESLNEGFVLASNDMAGSQSNHIDNNNNDSSNNERDNISNNNNNNKNSYNHNSIKNSVDAGGSVDKPCSSTGVSSRSMNEQIVLQMNKELVEKNKILMDENSQLIEELQIMRRWFQGTITDLNFQLSAGESKIVILQETIATYREALAARIEESTYTAVHETQTNVKDHNTSTNNSSNVIVASMRKNKKSPSLEISSRSSSLARTVSSPELCGVKLKTSLLHGQNIARRREQLVTKNQNLKTDIELLKVKAKSKRFHDRTDRTLPLISRSDEKVDPTKDNANVGNRLGNVEMSLKVRDSEQNSVKTHQHHKGSLNSSAKQLLHWWSTQRD